MVMVPANVDSVLVIAFRLILLLCCLYALCYLCAVIMQFLLEKYPSHRYMVSEFNR